MFLINFLLPSLALLANAQGAPKCSSLPWNDPVANIGDVPSFTVRDRVFTVSMSEAEEAFAAVVSNPDSEMFFLRFGVDVVDFESNGPEIKVNNTSSKRLG